MLNKLEVMMLRFFLKTEDLAASSLVETREEVADIQALSDEDVAMVVRRRNKWDSGMNL